MTKAHQIDKNLRVTMFSSATKVAGQGVGSAYIELIRLLERDATDSLTIHENSLKKSHIAHYHTIDFHFFLSTFFTKRFNRRIGYVHFLPETLRQSITLPEPIFRVFCGYVMKFYKRMDHLVVVNPDFVEKLVALKIPREKITYIPNFVAKDKWYRLPQKTIDEFRKEKNIPKKQFVVLGAGQIQERKGVADFVELAKRHPDLKFIWAGGFSFGRITDGYDKFKKIVENPPKNVTFTGIISREEMMKFYNAADLFLLPSFNELFPMSILEACSCGTPVMLRDLDLYHNILAGKYIPVKDLDEMDKQLKKILEKPTILDKYRKLSAEVSAEYSEEALCETWKAFYKEQHILTTKNKSS
ncbi:MAG: glycosyltransferase [Candidatus Nomurabacteria bacterium]|nr:glycosyltransferase [Candidatus Nomurabacteria bacterium]